jgi:hypothetical protein
MANRDLEPGALSKPPKGSGRLDRRSRRAADATRLKAAYEEVDRRHGPICAVTGVRFRFDSPDPRFTRHHHHLKGRRVRPDWIYRPERIIPCTAEAHDLIEGGFIDVEGNDARKPMFFHWNEEMMRGRKKPFRLVGKRTAA